MKSTKGFSLIEIIVAIGMFLLFTVGIYGGAQFISHSVYFSRLTILETGILNEQLEIVRNMAYADIGIVNGSPVGLLARTVTTTRNGIAFTITRTIRDIDDPFDGVIGGSPNDTAPVDYKIAQMDIICGGCGQQNAVSLTTQIGPKYLEGSTNHGALFIKVFDDNAAPILGANVHIVATSTSSTVDFVDTTGIDGMLREVDLSAGIGVYAIHVSKPGYTVDQTMPITVSLPNPVKPPASVVSQNVTSISFSIDHLSGVGVTSEDVLCQVVPNVPVTMSGTKLLGINPNTFKVNKTITTDASGNYSTSTLDGDAYVFRPTTADLIGSIPQLPVSIASGVTQPVQLVVGPASVNSLIVNVRDSITLQPIASALVTVTSTGFSSTKTTGVGFIRQTDWSGGGGQLVLTDATRYATDDSNIDVTTAPGNILLRRVGQEYVPSGFLESSIFDVGLNPTYVNLVWQPLSAPQGAGTSSLKFQIATSNTTTAANWPYLGPDDTSSTYFDADNPVMGVANNGNRYVRYKVFLSTASSTVTPTLSDLSLTYTNSCTPPGQTYIGSLSNQEYTVTVTKSGYQTKTEKITVSGDMIIGMDMVAQ